MRKRLPHRRRLRNRQNRFLETGYLLSRSLRVKPLYYWVGDDWIVIASELRQILRSPRCATRPSMWPSSASTSAGWSKARLRQSWQRPSDSPPACVGDRGWSVEKLRYWTPRFDDRIELRMRPPTKTNSARFYRGGALSDADVRTSWHRAQRWPRLDIITAMASRLARSGEGAVISCNALLMCFHGAHGRGRRYIKDAVDWLAVDWTPVLSDPDP